jgi:hypothetical protein
MRRRVMRLLSVRCGPFGMTRWSWAGRTNDAPRGRAAVVRRGYVSSVGSGGAVGSGVGSGGAVGGGGVAGGFVGFGVGFGVGLGV